MQNDLFRTELQRLGLIMKPANIWQELANRIHQGMLPEARITHTITHWGSHTNRTKLFVVVPEEGLCNDANHVDHDLCDIGEKTCHTSVFKHSSSMVWPFQTLSRKMPIWKTLVWHDLTILFWRALFGSCQLCSGFARHQCSIATMSSTMAHANARIPDRSPMAISFSSSLPEFAFTAYIRIYDRYISIYIYIYDM